MRILHITDLHFRSTNTQETFRLNKVIDEAVVELKKLPPIDMILFTGDLVWNGSVSEDFYNANAFLFERLSKQLDVQVSNIFLCAGNHDVDRLVHEKKPSINSHFALKLTDIVSLNTFVEKKTDDYADSVKPTSNYTAFASNHFSTANDIVDSLYSVHNRSIHGKTISICSFNTAWRAYSDQDSGNLDVAPLVIYEAMKHIPKEVDLKIALMHHPFSDLRPFLSYEIESLIYNHFDMLFTGHIHKQKIGSHYHNANGIFSLSSPATLSFEEKSEMGFSIVDFDLSLLNRVNVQRYKFDKESDCFHDQGTVVTQIPCGKEKSDQIDFRYTIRKRYESELQKANELLLDYNDGGRNFLELFNTPVLKEQMEINADEEKQDTPYDFEVLQQGLSNYFILGKDKSGRTSLLKKVQLSMLNTFTANNRVPFYIDFKEVDGISDYHKIIVLIARYYEINTKETIQLLENGLVIFLVDNFTPNTKLAAFLETLISKYPTNNFIYCSDFTVSRAFDVFSIPNTSYTRLFLNPITRKELREFASKHEIDENKKEELLDRVVAICTQLQLPFNYWIISLLLQIHQKTLEGKKNLYDILDLAIDQIFDKPSLTLTAAAVGFSQYKLLCSEMAFFLYQNHKSTVYGASQSEIIRFIEEYTSTNRRFIGTAKDTFEFLSKAGIIRHREDERWTFRLNGFFEYFLAYYLTKHTDFMQEVIKDNGLLLSFGNEMELFSGFKRDDIAFVTSIFERVQNICKEIGNDYYDQKDIDGMLAKKLKTSRELADRLEQLKGLEKIKPIQPEVVDQIKDTIAPLNGIESDVHLKHNIVDIDHLNQFERYLGILARVFKNSNEIADHAVVEKVFDFLIESYCLFAFIIIDDIQSGRTTKQIHKDYGIDEVTLIRMASKYVPLYCQVSLYEGVGHSNLQKVIEDKIILLKEKPKENQFKLFLLYLLLLDIDLEANMHYIDEMITVIKTAALSYASVLKLYYFMSVKSFNKPKLEKDIRNKIQEALQKIDDKTDVGQLHKKLSKKHQLNVVKASKLK